MTVELGHWTTGPNDPISLGVWTEEVLDDLYVVVDNPQLRMLMGPEALRLIERMRDAPRRQPPYWARISRMRIDPQPYFEAPEGHFIDANTGQIVVYEDEIPGQDPYWVIEKPHPPGAFTFGELVALHFILTNTLRKIADERELLSRKQRELAAYKLAESIDDLGRVIMVHQVDEHTAAQLKQAALETLARDQNPMDPSRAQSLKDRLTEL
jgi:hypothetical protein